MMLHEKKLEGAGQFVSFFGPLIAVLRQQGGSGKPRQICKALAETYNISEEYLSQRTSAGQSRFENALSWAKFYLLQAGYIYSPKRGVWSLTPQGHDVAMTDELALSIFKDVRNTVAAKGNDPDAREDETSAELVNYWFVGATGDGEDRSSNFVAKGIWRSFRPELSSSLTNQIKVGDRLALKSTYTRSRNVPFENRGRAVSVMSIKARGLVTGVRNDGETFDVEWELLSPTKEWFFYTYRTAISRAAYEDDERARQLVAFTFSDVEQDYNYFLKHNYWSQLYSADVDEVATVDGSFEQDGDHLLSVSDLYSVHDIIDEGGFLDVERLNGLLATLVSKKNLVLQGPPGTGKTWLAKRLGMALIGHRSPAHSQLRVMQFHPSLSYEDFVRGYRPGADGKLALTDGIFLQMIEAARAEPDIPHVLVIEEINRGNPAQIFGEMLTLLENTKRSRLDAMELAYRKLAGEKIHVPENLYIIGTMNVADRSLALVDLALRRRFAFVMLEPTLNSFWEDWCVERGLTVHDIETIRDRLNALNQVIAEDRSLGPHFCVGHSYVTPPKEGLVDGFAWFLDVVDNEIAPLLEEYWYDAPERVAEAKDLLQAPHR